MIYPLIQVPVLTGASSGISRRSRHLGRVLAKSNGTFCRYRYSPHSFDCRTWALAVKEEGDLESSLNSVHNFWSDPGGQIIKPFWVNIIIEINGRSVVDSSGSHQMIRLKFISCQSGKVLLAFLDDYSINIKHNCCQLYFITSLTIFGIE